MIAFIRFVLLQALQLVLQLIGIFMLIPACYFKYWYWSPSPRNRNPNTFAFHWRSKWLWIWDNDEDGVIGPSWYNLTRERWKAYVWSAWRNSVDNFKYLSIARWPNGPLYRREFNVFGKPWYFQAGWNQYGLMVLSGGAI